jgi:hypothetical protein
LPSTRAIPDRDVFYVAFPKSSIRPVGLPIYVARCLRGSIHSPLPVRLKPVRLGPFYVADPITSIETPSLPPLARCYPCSFTFYVADPITSIASVINHSSPVPGKSFDDEIVLRAWLESNTESK